MRDSISTPSESRLTVDTPMRYQELDGTFISRKTWLRRDNAGWVKMKERDGNWLALCINGGIIVALAAYACYLLATTR